MARDASYVVATSPREEGELSSLVAADKLVLRRNGLDLSAFADLPSGETFRVRYGIAKDDLLILYVGRISPIKNLDQLVLAFQEAALDKARLVLVGPLLEPDYEASLRALIAELKLSKRVLLSGPLYNEEKLAALSAADLFVLPSHYESYGNAAAEAVAAGIPVLLSEGCGIAPLIHGRAGLAVPATTAALVEGLRIMLEDRVERQKLTRQRAEVMRELSWDEPLCLAEQVYEKAIRQRR